MMVVGIFGARHAENNEKIVYLQTFASAAVPKAVAGGLGAAPAEEGAAAEESWKRR